MFANRTQRAETMVESVQVPELLSIYHLVEFAIYVDRGGRGHRALHCGGQLIQDDVVCTLALSSFYLSL